MRRSPEPETETGTPVDGPVSGHLSFMWRNALPNCVQIAHADNSFSLRHIKAFAIVLLLLLLLLVFSSCQIVTPTRAALCSSCQQTGASTFTSTSTTATGTALSSLMVDRDTTHSNIASLRIPQSLPTRCCHIADDSTALRLEAFQRPHLTKSRAFLRNSWK